MAKVYAPPEHIKLPEMSTFKGDFKSYDIACEKYEKEVVDFCKEESKCPDAGAVIGFPVGDGSATYVIYDYRTLIHIQTMDAYAIPEAHARGLRKADLVKLIKQKSALSDLFTSKI
jgi:hypothetical protein